MTDIRRTILWVIFGFSLVMLWDQWQVYNGKPATFFPSGKPAATAKGPSPAASANAAAAHVVRLRSGFAREVFKSAWSEPLKAAVRGELLQLFEKAAA